MFKDVKNNIYELISESLIRCLNTDKVFVGEILDGTILRNLNTNEMIPVMSFDAAEYLSVIDVAASGL